MRDNPAGKFAIVRGVPDSYSRCERPPSLCDPIDVHLARKQHRAYCEALARLGLEVIDIPPDETFPDCCFVEDAAVIAGPTAIITRMGAASRRGEEVRVREVLETRMTVREVRPPATVDGGDVLVIGRNIYVGVGGRTNEAAVQEVAALVDPGYRVLAMPFEGVLHLKSACTYVGGGYMLIRPGHFDPGVLGEYGFIEVTEEEAYAANCLSVNGSVLISSGYPQVKRAIQAKGFETLELEMSEFRKGQGSLTCLSKVF